MMISSFFPVSLAASVSETPVFHCLSSNYSTYYYLLNITKTML